MCVWNVTLNLPSHVVNLSVLLDSFIVGELIGWNFLCHFNKLKKLILYLYTFVVCFHDGVWSNL